MHALIFLLPLKNRPFFSFCSLKKMRSPILFLHAEDDHLVPLPVAQQVFQPIKDDKMPLKRFCLVATSDGVSFWCSFLFQVNLNYFALFFQLYEVAVSAQNAERVKLEPFDGSKGYLHNGLYRDPKLPGVLM